MFNTLLLHSARVFLLLLAGSVFATTARADDLFLADGRAFPGQLWRSESGGVERSIHHREGTANPAFPHAAMKVGQVAVGVDGKVFYVSGLDGYVMHLEGGRHEIAVFEFDGQVRDLACTGEEHTVYFSVVPTPQNGQPLADGKIYRRDLWDGRATEIATVRQADVGGKWWGAFTIRSGAIYIATFEDRSRLLKLTSTGAEAVFPQNTFKIHGLGVGSDGKFYFATGSDEIYTTDSFENVHAAFRGGRQFTDVAITPAADAPRP